MLVAVAVILWYVLESKFSLGGSSYQNVEEWSVVRDESGALDKIVIHRNAKQEG